MRDATTEPDKDRLQYHYQYEQGLPSKKPIQNSNELHGDLKRQDQPVKGSPKVPHKTGHETGRNDRRDC
jgi:hypothetical protein